MPLIIHPSSCCDVCLETLNYHDKPPFAIPCGHIFCRSCLFDMNPSICPLCRKPFLPGRSKKLITGEVEVLGEVDDRKATELLTKLVKSLGTEGHDSTVLEVDLWLSAGNTHVPLQKAHEVFKEYLLLKSEKSADLRLIRRLQREMSRLQADQSIEKENASAIERQLLSRIEKLKKKVREFEERSRAATTITFNHNPLPIPPEPLPLESLPFLANLQQNPNLSNDNLPQRPSDRATQNTLHLDDVPTNAIEEGLIPTAPRAPSSDQTTIPSTPIPTVNGHTSNYRSAIIPGASPNQRFVPRSVFAEPSSPVWANVYGQPTLPVDPFVLAADYFTEYAGGFEEGYRLSQHHLQPSNRQTRRTTESAVPSVAEPLDESNVFSSRTIDDRLSHQLPDHRPLGLRDFYTTSTTSSSSREDPRSAPRASSSRPSISSSSSARIHDEQPRVSPEWPMLSTISTSPAPLEAPGTAVSEDRRSGSYSLPSSSSASMTSDSRQSQSLPPPPTSVPRSSVLDSSSLRSSRIMSSPRPRDQRRRSENFEISYTPRTGEVMAPVASDSSLSRRSAFSASTSSVHPSPLSGVVSSPASIRTVETMNSWGTVSTDSPNQISHQPFRPAHQINSVSDLGLRLFDDLTSPNAGTASQRSSLLSNVTQPFPSSHLDLEGNGNGDSQNRTPRVVPRSLPAIDSASSSEARLPPFVPSRDSDRNWNIFNTIHSPYRDLDHNQHHGTPSGASETWYRASADLTSIRSSSLAHSHSVSGPSDRSSRGPRHRTSRPPTAIIPENTISSRWETTSLVSGATNALGLTDLVPSPEPRISAPAPITPSRSFLRYYNEHQR